mmetsp:Transcript_134687/g.430247  ORF Transcript_134687/g.430247 Transcript_134687/m.430247 type:complete len:267 (+) Transcript_134687:58-858(+)
MAGARTARALRRLPPSGRTPRDPTDLVEVAVPASRPPSPWRPGPPGWCRRPGSPARRTLRSSRMQVVRRGRGCRAAWRRKILCSPRAPSGAPSTCKPRARARRAAVPARTRRPSGSSPFWADGPGLFWPRRSGRVPWMSSPRTSWTSCPLGVVKSCSAAAGSRRSSTARPGSSKTPGARRRPFGSPSPWSTSTPSCRTTGASRGGKSSCPWRCTSTSGSPRSRRSSSPCWRAWRRRWGGCPSGTPKPSSGPGGCSAGCSARRPSSS